jgi:DNA-binding PadR family transcriptional regulator
VLRYGRSRLPTKKTISEELEDFTQLKLPHLLHLEGMAKNGLLSPQRKNRQRPVMTVYAVTEKGKKAFSGNLLKQLAAQYSRNSTTTHFTFPTNCRGGGSRSAVRGERE